MLTITTISERIGHWTRMRWSLARFSGSEASNHTRSLADFITITCAFRFSVHTGVIALLNDCLEVTRAHDLALATQLLLITQLELRLKTHAISDEEFRQYCLRLESTVEHAARAADSNTNGQAVG